MRFLLVAAVLVALAGCGPGEQRVSGKTTSSVTLEHSEIDCALVGQWRLEEGPLYLTSNITICIDHNGDYHVQEEFDFDGSIYENQLTSVGDPAGVRFLRQKHLTDYYELLPDGQLEVGASNGPIGIALPIP